MTARYYIACDLGAESGRVILGKLEGARLSLEEIHRFENGPVHFSGSLHWDVQRLFHELKIGLTAVGARGVPVASLSCDSWGVDYVLLDGNGLQAAPSYHYRDARTDGALEKAFSRVSAEEIFQETGIQLMPINTLYQILADLQSRPAVLESAARFLNIGDYFNFLCSHVARAEESLASTTQLYNPRTRQWSSKLMERFGIPRHIFPDVVSSGTVLGSLLSTLCDETGLNGVQVVAGCSHDTGAAVAAVPADGDDWVYLSSGTWSLLGIERGYPIIDEKSREYEFTNEIGYGGSIRFQKNIVGLWVLQECRRQWAREGKEYTYEHLMELAEIASPMRSLVDLADERFTKSDNMPAKIASYCRENNQPVPSELGEFVRCILESLALSYRRTLEQLEESTGTNITTLHIVGGGSKNRLLNQLTANAIGRTVLAGPVECTAIGNILIQALALGHLPSLKAAREIVRTSFPLELYKPADTAVWNTTAKKHQLIVH